MVINKPFLFFLAQNLAAAMSTTAIVGSCAIIGLLAGYEQTGRSLEKVSHFLPL